MNWLSRKSNSGKTSHFIPKETVRNISDDSENPVTFANMLDEDSNFSEQVKNDFESNPRTETDDKSDYEMARKIMDEADDIGESSLSDEEKIIDLYNLYQNYDEILSEAQKGILLGKIEGINKNIRLVDKNNKTANKIQHNIQELIYGKNVPEQRKQAEQKSEKIQERQNSSDSASDFIRKNYDDDDWLERSAIISAMAEN
jgi:hypothetical protein